ncbi:MAG: Acetylornithine deacetylase/Succinyl-diaminopimelate desuccinylase and related deacylases [uncultured Thermomicrobiales bacterium]|uniref:Acetylornithine deacetylase/Succinyl-diaminopimelate desuccinylase and related deacylases n=1 Tax=uncultured Thermomicrobiales bacterium TaxID=1645740 RepID=A0A6J4UW49_9BACT|nr:MAG: Acetylornithine deacetylase/Succinyl-diaminopimelate desuccinylase and related deacylases [uncultured Thermomicrobiales bacterium]
MTSADLASLPLDGQLAEVLAACGRNRERDLADLFRLLAQPSISAQGIGVDECSELVRDLLERSGFAARIMATPGAPVVYGERCNAPGQPTLLIYGHYDVQPADPLEAWDSPPFEPTIRDGRIWARGVADNKGQFVANVLGARAWLETVGELPINVKVVVEGEEESGSPNFPAFVAANRDLLAADLVYVSDGQVFETHQPIVEFGNRGMLYIELVAHGPSRDLHSGNFGGVAPNPAWTLVHLLATMFSPDGEILVPGVLDAVRPVTPELRTALDAIPLDEAAALADIGLTEKAAPKDLPYYDRLMVRPTMNIAGFTSGYGGAGSKTVLPAEARVKMDLRLVPNQDPAVIYDQIRAHVAAHAPGVEILHHGAMEPVAVALDSPLAAPVRRAVEVGFGVAPVDVPMVGGSLPSAVWPKELGVPAIVVPYGNADQANHSPNENMITERFYAGIRTSAALLGAMVGQNRQI